VIIARAVDLTFDLLSTNDFPAIDDFFFIDDFLSTDDFPAMGMNITMEMKT
jgi:hypothetical protein